MHFMSGPPCNHGADSETALDYDIEGRPRRAGGATPSIGAFEYVAPASEFLAEIQVATGEWREGSAPTVELIYDFSDVPPKGDIDGEVVLTAPEEREWRFLEVSGTKRFTITLARATV